MDEIKSRPYDTASGQEFDRIFGQKIPWYEKRSSESVGAEDRTTSTPGWAFTEPLYPEDPFFQGVKDAIKDLINKWMSTNEVVSTYLLHWPPQAENVVGVNFKYAIPLKGEVRSLSQTLTIAFGYILEDLRTS